MVYSVIIFSFILEGVMSTLFNLNTIYIPLFVISSLTILYPYLKNKTLNYIIIYIICGFLYDFIFCNAPFINTIVFSFCSIFTIFAYKYIKYNIFNSNILNIIIIILYRLFSYCLLLLVGYLNLKKSLLITGIYSSIFMNVLYFFIIYIILYLVSKILKGVSRDYVKY